MVVRARHRAALTATSATGDPLSEREANDVHPCSNAEPSMETSARVSSARGTGLHQHRAAIGECTERSAIA